MYRGLKLEWQKRIFLPPFLCKEFSVNKKVNLRQLLHLVSYIVRVTKKEKKVIPAMQKEKQSCYIIQLFAEQIWAYYLS